MTTPLEMTEENLLDLEYIYNLVRSYPRPETKVNEHCAKFGHLKTWVITDKKMRLRKEYAKNCHCRNCHIIL